MIRANINVKKIDKSALVEGKNGALYCGLTLIANREGRDQYGNDGMVVQDIGKERREAGERGAILGNYKDLDGGAPAKPHQAKPVAKPQTVEDDCDDIPF